ncbi:MAG TPA: hypothetical protein VK401_08385 [Propionibacteriaceae bacterium]|jgi:hypothetical protein|nr:hypothetical protein [Propionibacteriaceae bacterium]
MTITDQRIVAQPRTEVRDLRTFWRLALAIALPIGPLLVTVARAILPYWTNDDPTTIVAKTAAAPATMNLLIWLGAFLTPCMIVSMLTLGYVARRGAPVLATVGTVLSFAAYALWGAIGNTDYTATVLLAAGYGVDEVTALTGHLDSTVLSMAVGSFWVLGHILGLVILAIALHRARVLPLWAATVMALSQPVHLVSAVILPSRWLDVFGGWGMTTLTCALVAVHLWRTRNEDWDLPPIR